MKLGKYLKAQSKIFYVKQNVAFNSKLIVSAGGKKNANNSDFIFQSEFLYIVLTNPAKHRHKHENIQILTPMSPGWLPTLIWTMSWCKHSYPPRFLLPPKSQKMILSHSKISIRRLWWGLNQPKVSCSGKEVSCWLPPLLCCPHSTAPPLPRASASLCGESVQKKTEFFSEFSWKQWVVCCHLGSLNQLLTGVTWFGQQEEKRWFCDICVMFLHQLSLELSLI